MKKIVLLFAMVGVSTFAAKSKIGQFSIKKKRILNLSPSIFNPQTFLFEFGFITNKSFKKYDYHYHAYAKAFLGEESKNEKPSDRSAALGAKLGVFFPTQPWKPLYLDLGFGFAKTAVQSEPWFGDREDSVADTDMFLAEAGLMYTYSDTYFIRAIYQVNNVDYFKRDVYFSVGGFF